jgi:hypothetical protein
MTSQVRPVERCNSMSAKKIWLSATPASMATISGVEAATNNCGFFGYTIASGIK